MKSIEVLVVTISGIAIFLPVTLIFAILVFSSEGYPYKRHFRSRFSKKTEYHNARYVSLLKDFSFKFPLLSTVKISSFEYFLDKSLRIYLEKTIDEEFNKDHFIEYIFSLKKSFNTSQNKSILKLNGIVYFVTEEESYSISHHLIEKALKEIVSDYN